MAVKIPSLSELCLAKTSQLLEQDIKNYYEDHPLGSSNSKDQIAVYCARLAKACNQLFHSSRPWETTFYSLPLALVSKCPIPHFLPMVPADEKSAQQDLALKLFAKFFPNAPFRSLPSIPANQQFYAELLQSIFQKCGGDFRQFTAKDFALFAENRENIHALMFQRCSLLTDRHLTSMISLFPDIRYLSLKNCPALSEKALLEALHEPSKLEHLSLGFSSAVTSNVLKCLQSTRNLRHLELASIDPTANMQLIVKIVQANPQLESLTLGHFDQLRDHHLIEILQQAPRLRSLSLISCNRVNIGQCLEKVYSNQSTPYELHIENCAGLAAQDFPTEAPYAYPLEALSVRNCPNMQELGPLLSRCPYLKASEEMQAAYY